MNTIGKMVIGGDVNEVCQCGSTVFKQLFKVKRILPKDSKLSRVEFRPKTIFLCEKCEKELK